MYVYDTCDQRFSLLLPKGYQSLYVSTLRLAQRKLLILLLIASSFSSIFEYCKILMVCLLFALIKLISLTFLAKSDTEQPHSNFKIASLICRDRAISSFWRRSPRRDSYFSTSTSTSFGSYSQPIARAGPEETDGLSPVTTFWKGGGGGVWEQI